MKKELDLFYIDGQPGFDQDGFKDRWMKLGGCGAVTVCDCCIYLARKFGLEHLYPYNAADISKSDYIDFAMRMKPYLSPRFSGIDSTALLIDGFKDYLKSVGDKSISFGSLQANCDYGLYKNEIKRLLDGDIPVPMLNLKHKDPALSDFVWHWFWLAGYEEFGDEFMVKLITYGEYYWFSLKNIWDSGYSRKGGIVKIELARI